MLELLANALFAYLGFMALGFGALVAALATGPFRLVAMAVCLLMVAAPHSQLGGPRL